MRHIAIILSLLPLMAYGVGANKVWRTDSSGIRGWGAVDLGQANSRTGTLPLGNGGTGQTTAAGVTSILNAVVGDSGSGGTKGLVPAPGAGDAAANKFLKADGTWSTLAPAFAVPQVTAYTSGSGTYTPPAGALYLLVEAAGAGGGGAGGGGVGTGATDGGDGSGNTTVTGTNVTMTMSFGGGGKTAAKTGGTDGYGGGGGNGSCTGSALTVIRSGQGGSGTGAQYNSGANIGMQGGNGGISYFDPGGYGGEGYNGSGQSAGSGVHGSGGGGGGDLNSTTSVGGAGGGAGGYCKVMITTIPGSLSYSIATGGGGGSAGTNGKAGAAGGNGYILITAYFQ